MKRPHRIQLVALASAATVGVILVVGYMWLGPANRATSLHAFTPAEKQELGAFVREYLVQNPEVIAEAIKELRRRHATAQQARVEDTIAAMSDEIFASESSPVGGNPDGDVTLVEFFDYNCPYCRTIKPTVVELLKSDGNVRFVYKEFPILGETSIFAAKVALAAVRQSRELYEELHIRLLDTKGRLTEEIILAAARDVGLEMGQLRRDMEDPAIQAEIEQNRALARSLSITGTPTFIVGTQILAGAQSGDALKQAIRQARKQGG